MALPAPLKDILKLITYNKNFTSFEALSKASAVELKALTDQITAIQTELTARRQAIEPSIKLKNEFSEWKKEQSQLRRSSQKKKKGNTENDKQNEKPKKVEKPKQESKPPCDISKVSKEINRIKDETKTVVGSWVELVDRLNSLYAKYEEKLKLWSMCFENPDENKDEDGDEEELKKKVFNKSIERAPKEQDFRTSKQKYYNEIKKIFSEATKEKTHRSYVKAVEQAFWEAFNKGRPEMLDNGTLLCQLLIQTNVSSLNDFMDLGEVEMAGIDLSQTDCVGKQSFELYDLLAGATARETQNFVDDEYNQYKFRWDLIASVICVGEGIAYESDEDVEFDNDEDSNNVVRLPQSPSYIAGDGNEIPWNKFPGGTGSAICDAYNRSLKANSLARDYQKNAGLFLPQLYLRKNIDEIIPSTAARDFFLKERYKRLALNALIMSDFHLLDPVIADHSCEMRPPFIWDAYQIVKDYIEYGDLTSITMYEALRFIGFYNKQNKDVSFDENKVKIQPLFDAGYDGANYHYLYRGCMDSLKSEGKDWYPSYLYLCFLLTRTRYTVRDPLGVECENGESFPIAANDIYQQCGVMADYTVDYISDIAEKEVKDASQRKLLVPQHLNFVIGDCDVAKTYHSVRERLLPIYSGQRAALRHMFHNGAPIVMRVSRIHMQPNKAGKAITFKKKNNSGDIVVEPYQYQLAGADVLVYMPNPKTGAYEFQKAVKDNAILNMPAYTVSAYSVLNSVDPDKGNNYLPKFFQSDNPNVFFEGLKQCDLLQLIVLCAANHPPFDPSAAYPIENDMQQQYGSNAESFKAWKYLLEQCYGFFNWSHINEEDTLKENLKVYMKDSMPDYLTGKCHIDGNVADSLIDELLKYYALATVCGLDDALYKDGVLYQEKDDEEIKEENELLNKKVEEESNKSKKKSKKKKKKSKDNDQQNEVKKVIEVQRWKKTHYGYRRNRDVSFYTTHLHASCVRFELRRLEMLRQRTNKTTYDRTFDLTACIEQHRQDTLDYMIWRSNPKNWQDLESVKK